MTRIAVVGAGAVASRSEVPIGSVVDIGAEHGVPTPANAMLLTLPRAVSGRAVDR